MNAETPQRTPPAALRHHELAMAMAARRPSATTETLTTKENAKGEGLIEALTTYRAEGEDWQAWIDRHALMHLAVSLAIRPTESGEE